MWSSGAGVILQGRPEDVSYIDGPASASALHCRRETDKLKSQNNKTKQILLCKVKTGSGRSVMTKLVYGQLTIDLGMMAISDTSHHRKTNRSLQAMHCCGTPYPMGLLISVTFHLGTGAVVTLLLPVAVGMVVSVAG